ncbi:lysozyme inhibitor LprI family protein [Paracoccus sediminilitoris]|uniref:lysozyme inhibitor LprI family protein n=1 Tax=Paracoccus sediminilitoris TaxID=2202419 RepID=UPI000DB93CC9|nr:lysozyme inhibitor LprI family protein [Paracoccus sediminilitoris]
MKRSSYHQITDWNERRGDQPRLGIELVHQIDALCEGAASVVQLSSTFVEFIPIRLVTTLEVFLRGVISELINGREEYFERGEKLAKGAKIDLAFAAHLNRRELTIGDFVAHTVSLNSVDAVLSVLDTLLGGFPAKLKVAHPRWSEEADDWPLPPIIEDYATMVASLARLYEVRHILTHELPQIAVLDPEELQHLAAATKEFIAATDWVVVEALHGAVPRTQTAMNVSAGSDLHQEEARLAETLLEVSEIRGVDPNALRALQEGWRGWADAQAALVASQVEGGSMYPMVWAREKTVLTRERRDQLTRLKAEWMDR